MGKLEAPTPGTLRRRVRDVGLRKPLLERGGELEALHRTLRAARTGAGSVIVIDGPAGRGKSRLLSVAGDLAREVDLQVLGAHASTLERDFPFGVAIQLFEPRWVASDANAQAAMLEGPARLAASLLSGHLPEPGPALQDQAYPLIHALFWMACNMIGPTGDGSIAPLAMLVDDIHWADRPSLRFLSYLAERIADLPIAIVITMRSGEVSSDSQALAAIRNVRRRELLRPASLSGDGVRELVLEHFADADEDFCTACASLTGGNPFLLVELLSQVRVDGQTPDGATAERLAEMAPESVLNATVARLGSMSQAARQLASAVAVMGSATPEQAARLAGITLGQAVEAADALSAVHLLHLGSPLSFVHPLVGSAVAASMSPHSRAQAHRRAALILIADGASDEAVAAHLLVAVPDGDPRAARTLRSAAQKAFASGATASAIRLLERALAEMPAATPDPEVLAELGQAEALAGLPGATQHLEQAIALTVRPERRAELVLSRARALYSQGRYGEAAAALGHGLRELGGGGTALKDELEAAYVAAASLLPETGGEALERRVHLLETLTATPTAGQRSALAHIAAHDALHGKRRQAVCELTELAWGDGALLQAETADGLGWPLLTGALFSVDELEREVEICDAVIADCRRRESTHAYATVSYCRAWPLYEQGWIIKAEADARSGLDARPDDRRTHVRTAFGAIACCNIQRGEFGGAETALAIVEAQEVRGTISFPLLLDVRAQLRLAQHRPKEALQDALQAGESLQSDFATASPGTIAWRSTAALAHLALGNSDDAQQLAEAELDDAQRAGITRVTIRDLRVLGLAVGGAAGIELLRKAVAIGERYPRRLEYIRALVDLGAALRRANKRTAAREPLRKGLELSHQGGVSALAERARAELVASGARPRRVLLSGVEALTPSERRVADLAAQGLTTRRIAEALFVTPKTVEYHLRHTYQKLDISSRSELAGILAR